MDYLQDVYLSQGQFEKDLETCLTIINYPNKRKLFYVCEHISAALYKSKVKVFIKK